jgi:hypothetical protein
MAMSDPYKPMRGRPDRLNCETPEAQSASGKRGGLKKLDANQIEALWDASQAHMRATFYWKAPEVAK